MIEPSNLDVMNEIQQLEKMAGIKPNHPLYHYNGRQLKWGEDLSPETIHALREESEVFLLMDANNQPYLFLLADGYGNFRQNLINTGA